MNTNGILEKLQETDPPLFIKKLTDLAVKIGTRTRFLVEIQSSSSPQVTWHRNHEPVDIGSRFSFVHEGNFYCIDVAPVTLEDGGHWTCTAENDNGRSSCSCYLNVLVPKAYKKPHFIEELQAILTESGSVSLECKVLGVPTPVLKWFKDGKEMKAGDIFALTASLDDPTSLGIYRCEAVNCMGVACSSSQVHVINSEDGQKSSVSIKSLESLPVFEKFLKDQSCKIGESLILSCQIQVPPWPKDVAWYNESGRIEPNEKYHIVQDAFGIYSVEIHGIEAVDKGRWKCVATSLDNAKQFTTSYVAVLIPKNYRIPRFMEDLRAILTEEGLVSFECKVVGFPTPVLKWFKDGEELKPGDVYQLTGTNSLGSYCCIAKNCMGEAKSTAELTIEDIENQLNEEERLQLAKEFTQVPKFKKGLKSCEAKIDEAFTFAVQIDVTLSADPSVSWYRNDELISGDVKYKLVKETLGNFHLEIKNLELVDESQWKCLAENDFGHSVTSCFLKLIIPKHFRKPKYLENLKAVLSEDGTVSLECKVIGVPQPALTWYKDGIELKPGDVHRIISGENGTCCLGTYTCRATNCMGSVSSSASLLGFEDDAKQVQSQDNQQLDTSVKNVSLSTIHEERTSQLYDTPQSDYSVTQDDHGEVSFSLDGKEVSLSLYETPDLTEEDAIQIMEMYADQLSEHITEGDVIELPPMRFTKETSTTGNLLMEAVVIDVSPDYFIPNEKFEDLRTEVDVEDVSIMEDQSQSNISSYSSAMGGQTPVRPVRKRQKSEGSGSSQSDHSEKSHRKSMKTDQSEAYHSAREPSSIEGQFSLDTDNTEAIRDDASSVDLHEQNLLKIDEPADIMDYDVIIPEPAIIQSEMSYILQDPKRIITTISNLEQTIQHFLLMNEEHDEPELVMLAENLEMIYASLHPFIFAIASHKTGVIENPIDELLIGILTEPLEDLAHATASLYSLGPTKNSLNNFEKFVDDFKLKLQTFVTTLETYEDESCKKDTTENYKVLAKNLDYIMNNISKILFETLSDDKRIQIKSSSSKPGETEEEKKLSRAESAPEATIGQLLLVLTSIHFELSSILERISGNSPPDMNDIESPSNLIDSIERLRQCIGDVTIAFATPSLFDANMSVSNNDRVLNEFAKLEIPLHDLQENLTNRKYQVDETYFLKDMMRPLQHLKTAVNLVKKDNSELEIIQLLESIERHVSLIPIASSNETLIEEFETTDGIPQPVQAGIKDECKSEEAVATSARTEQLLLWTSTAFEPLEQLANATLSLDRSINEEIHALLCEPLDALHDQIVSLQSALKNSPKQTLESDFVAIIQKLLWPVNQLRDGIERTTEISRKKPVESVTKQNLEEFLRSVSDLCGQFQFLRDQLLLEPPVASLEVQTSDAPLIVTLTAVVESLHHVSDAVTLMLSTGITEQADGVHSIPDLPETASIPSDDSKKPIELNDIEVLDDALIQKSSQPLEMIYDKQDSFEIPTDSEDNKILANIVPESTFKINDNESQIMTQYETNEEKVRADESPESLLLDSTQQIEKSTAPENGDPKNDQELIDKQSELPQIFKDTITEDPLNYAMIQEETCDFVENKVLDGFQLLLQNQVAYIVEDELERQGAQESGSSDFIKIVQDKVHATVSVSPGVDQESILEEMIRDIVVEELHSVKSDNHENVSDIINSSLTLTSEQAVNDEIIQPQQIIQNVPFINEEKFHGITSDESSDMKKELIDSLVEESLETPEHASVIVEESKTSDKFEQQNDDYNNPIAITVSANETSTHSQNNLMMDLQQALVSSGIEDRDTRDDVFKDSSELLKIDIAGIIEDELDRQGARNYASLNFIQLVQDKVSANISSNHNIEQESALEEMIRDITVEELQSVKADVNDNDYRNQPQEIIENVELVNDEKLYEKVQDESSEAEKGARPEEMCESLNYAQERIDQSQIADRLNQQNDDTKNLMEIALSIKEETRHLQFLSNAMADVQQALVSSTIEDNCSTGEDEILKDFKISLESDTAHVIEGELNRGDAQDYAAINVINIIQDKVQDLEFMEEEIVGDIAVEESINVNNNELDNDQVESLEMAKEEIQIDGIWESPDHLSTAVEKLKSTDRSDQGNDDEENPMNAELSTHEVTPDVQIKNDSLMNEQNDQALQDSQMSLENKIETIIKDELDRQGAQEYASMKFIEDVQNKIYTAASSNYNIDQESIFQELVRDITVEELQSIKSNCNKIPNVNIDLSSYMPEQKSHNELVERELNIQELSESVPSLDSTPKNNEKSNAGIIVDANTKGGELINEVNVLDDFTCQEDSIKDNSANDETNQVLDSSEILNEPLQEKGHTGISSVPDADQQLEEIIPVVVSKEELGEVTHDKSLEKATENRGNPESCEVLTLNFTDRIDGKIASEEDLEVNIKKETPNNETLPIDEASDDPSLPRNKIALTGLIDAPEQLLITPDVAFGNVADRNENIKQIIEDELDRQGALGYASINFIELVQEKVHVAALEGSANQQAILEELIRDITVDELQSVKLGESVINDETSVQNESILSSEQKSIDSLQKILDDDHNPALQEIWPTEIPMDHNNEHETVDLIMPEVEKIFGNVIQIDDHGEVIDSKYHETIFNNPLVSQCQFSDHSLEDLSSMELGVQVAAQSCALDDLKNLRATTTITDISPEEPVEPLVITELESASAQAIELEKYISPVKPSTHSMILQSPVSSKQFTSEECTGDLIIPELPEEQSKIVADDSSLPSEEECRINISDTKRGAMILGQPSTVDVGALWEISKDAVSPEVQDHQVALLKSNDALQPASQHKHQIFNCPRALDEVGPNEYTQDIMNNPPVDYNVAPVDVDPLANPSEHTVRVLNSEAVNNKSPDEKIVLGRETGPANDISQSIAEKKENVLDELRINREEFSEGDSLKNNEEIIDATSAVPADHHDLKSVGKTTTEDNQGANKGVKESVEELSENLKSSDEIADEQKKGSRSPQEKKLRKIQKNKDEKSQFSNTERKENSIASAMKDENVEEQIIEGTESSPKTQNHSEEKNVPTSENNNSLEKGEAISKNSSQIADEEQLALSGEKDFMKKKKIDEVNIMEHRDSKKTDTSSSFDDEERVRKGNRVKEHEKSELPGAEENGLQETPNDYRRSLIEQEMTSQYGKPKKINHTEEEIKQTHLQNERQQKLKKNGTRTRIKGSEIEDRDYTHIRSKERPTSDTESHTEDSHLESASVATNLSLDSELSESSKRNVKFDYRQERDASIVLPSISIDTDELMTSDQSRSSDYLAQKSRKYRNEYGSDREYLPGPRHKGKKPVFCMKLIDRTAAAASRIKLTCTALGDPEPRVFWMQNGRELSQTSNRYCITNDNGVISLEIYSVKSEDSGEYACIAKNIHGEASTEAKLKVYAGYESTHSSPIFTRPMRDTFKRNENKFILECRVRAQPPPIITWLKDGKIMVMNDRCRQSDLAEGICRLQISNPCNDDDGIYTCRAENKSGFSECNSRFTYNEHAVAPKFDLTSLSAHNKRHNLTSEMHSTVDYDMYSFILSDPFGIDRSIYSHRTDLSIECGNVKLDGGYLCLKENGKPAIFISRPVDKLINACVGEDVSLSFRVGGVPKPKVILMKGLVDITNGTRSYKESHDDYVRITFKRIEDEDEGTYCILVKNRYGYDRTFFTIRVKQRARSLTPARSTEWNFENTKKYLSHVHEPTHSQVKFIPGPISSEPVVVDGGKTWLALSWGKAEQRGPAPIVAYRVDAWLLGGDGGARWIELGVTSTNSFDAFNLCPGEEYKFRITPKNRYGWGESVTMTNSVTVKEIVKFPEFSEILPGQLKALVGTTLNLNCEIESNKSVAHVRWYKDNVELDGTHDQRVVINNVDLKCSLSIADIGERDSGRYVCDATNSAGRVSTFARVQVVTDPKIADADLELRTMRANDRSSEERPPEFTMRLRDRRVQATYPVRLTCQVDGNPEPVITWYKDEEEINIEVENMSIWKDEAHFHTLEINRSKIDNTGIYMVRAQNAFGCLSCRCHLVVDEGIRAYIAPEFLHFLNPVYTVVQNQELRMTAQIEAYPAIGITWYRDGKRLRPNRNTVMSLHHDGTVELTLAHITCKDAGVYCCIATNEVGRAENKTQVNVLMNDDVDESMKSSTETAQTSVIPYSREPVFITKPLSTEAFEGDNIIILCQVIGDPKPDVIWLRDFLKPDYYKDAPHFRPVGLGPQYQLEIPYAKLDFTGTYSVIAKNCYGEAKAVISLQIYARDPDRQDINRKQIVKHSEIQTLPVIQSPLKSIRCCDGDAVTFICKINATPPPSIRWEKGGKLVPLQNDVSFDFEDETARLHIQQVYPEDEGEYICVAYNDLGSAYTSACLIVDVPEGKEICINRRLKKPISLLSPNATPISTPRSTPIRSLSPSCVIRELTHNTGRRGRIPAAPKFYAIPHNRVAEEGDTIRFQCSVTGHPIPWANWDKDGITVISSARVSITEKDDLRILEIAQIAYEDAGLYRITLENDIGRVEATARLEVIRGKHASVSRGITHSSRQNRSASDRPPFYPTLSPDYQSRSSTSLDKYSGISRTTPTYLLPHHREKSSRDEYDGSFFCTEVEEKGPVILTAPADVLAIKGETVVLLATYSGFPKAVPQWFCEGKKVMRNDQIKIQTMMGFTRLIMNEITRKQAGKYSVCIENTMGGDSIDAHVIVQESASVINPGGTISISIPRAIDCESHMANINRVDRSSMKTDSINEGDTDLDEMPEFSIVEVMPREIFDDHYDILEEIGKGRYGVVRKVLDKSSEINRAAKFVRTIKNKDRQQVLKEIDIMNTMKHPKLMRLVAAFEGSKEMIMVTEYISGGELFERVAADDFTLTEQDSVLFVRQICEGVAYMHDQHIVHMDLKPENIMCQSRTCHRIKLIDFGLAQTLQPNTPVRVLFGTPEFVSPEIISFEPIGTESDMWSIGVICYVLLTGLSPFMGDNDAETFVNITRADYDFDDEAFSAISKEAIDFISSLLIKRKELRLSAKDCLEHPWLAQCAENMNRVVLPTDKLKNFIVRRKWQKTGNAIRALGRMAILSAKSRKNISTETVPEEIDIFYPPSEDSLEISELNISPTEHSLIFTSNYPKNDLSPEIISDKDIEERITDSSIDGTPTIMEIEGEMPQLVQSPFTICDESVLLNKDSTESQCETNNLQLGVLIDKADEGANPRVTTTIPPLRHVRTGNVSRTAKLFETEDVSSTLHPPSSRLNLPPADARLQNERIRKAFEFWNK
ncbi:uncharacterized protein [Fopius arisanus]|uniref:Myosin light chain kinase, smooth muscle n=1 Tax=Fopius arisanus TaxID=64838 RepID=A0A9R1TUE2_9HYME|nr:PREDICTED: uncharacterized protein LOC105274079 [Fopius arisanus]